MLHILGITGPIYLVIALGFLAGRFDVFSKPDMRVLGTYVVKFALPALIFTTLSQRPVSQTLDLRYLLGYAAGSVAVMFAAFAYGRKVQRKSFTLSVLCGLGMSSSNSGYIGLPIAVQVVGGGTAGVALAMNMVVENLLMIPLALAMADAGSIKAGASRTWHSAARGSLLQLLRNPIILAMLGGIAVASLDLQISGVLARTINMLSLSSAAVSLFVIGGSLVGLTTKGMRRDVSAIAMGKLLVHPLAVGLLLWCFPPSDPGLRAAGVVFAGVPMLSIYPILAQKYGFESFCAAALLLATVMSFITISMMLWLLGPSALAWRG
jgi:malonate transporter